MRDELQRARDWESVPFDVAVSKETFSVGKVQLREYRPQGRFPIIDQGQRQIAGYWDDESDVYQGPLPVVVFGDHTRAVKFVDHPFVAGADGTKVLVPNGDRFDPEFFFYTLSAMKLPSRGYNRHFSLLRETTLPCPPMSEQRAIASTLRSIQRARDSTSALVDSILKLRDAILRHLLMYGAVDVDRTANVALKSTQIGSVPEHWDVALLSEVCERPQYGMTATASSEARGPKFLRITDLTAHGVDWETVPYAEGQQEDVERYKLNNGDIVVARIGATTGKSYLVTDPPDAIFASYLIRLRAKPALLPAFLAIVMQSATYWSQIDAAKGGRLKLGVNIPVLSRLVVPLPPKRDQEEIARIVEAVDRKISAVALRRLSLSQLFETVRDELITGARRIDYGAIDG